MDTVLCPRVAEFGSQGVGPKVLGDLRIHWADKLSEGLHSILLSDLHYDARADCHSLYHTDELWQHTLVYFEELLSRWLVKSEHLHGRDLKALLKNSVDYLAGQTILYDMWFDNATGAIIEGGGRREVLREEKFELPLVVCRAG